MARVNRNLARPHRVYVVRAFGWQLDYRPDGWLPLFVSTGWASRGRWFVVPLGRLGCITLGQLSRLPVVGCSDDECVTEEH